MAESQKKVSSLTIELATKNSIEDGDSNQIMYAKVQLKCKICNNLFDKVETLKLHLVQEHNDEIDCFKCVSVFRKEAEVFSHSNNSFGIIPLNICDKCEKCCEQISTKEAQTELSGQEEQITSSL